MHVECVKCGKPFQSRPAPCPDGIEGCLVSHFDDQSFLCPHCGHDNHTAVATEIIRAGHKVEIGMGVANLDGIRKLTLDK